MGQTSRVLGICAAALVVLAGCSDDDTDPTPTGAASTSTASAPPTASASPSTTTSAPASPVEPDLTGFDLEDKNGGGFPDLGDDVGSGEGVRVGQHEGYDRVVFDFDDTGTPTYLVRYVDTPVADGSGDTVEVQGDAYLEVLVTNVSIPQDGQSPPADPGPADLAGTVFAEANAIFGGFEGYGQSFIGVNGEDRPFRVGLESSPTRLVIDVAR